MSSDSRCAVLVSLAGSAAVAGWSAWAGHEMYVLPACAVSAVLALILFLEERRSAAEPEELYCQAPTSVVAQPASVPKFVAAARQQTTRNMTPAEKVSAMRAKRAARGDARRFTRSTPAPMAASLSGDKPASASKEPGSNDKPITILWQGVKGLRKRFSRAETVAKVASEAGVANPERKFRVAVVGGGPSGACAAEVFADEPNVETFLFERKMDNCKPCGGAIPLCMVDEFDLPETIIDRKVRRMTMISPTNREIPIGQTLKDNEYIGMTRREVLDKYLRDRAVEKGAQSINALVTSIDLPASENSPYKIHFSKYSDDGTVESKKSVGTPETLEVDVIIGADGANSRVAQAVDAGEYNFAIAFQERIKITDEQMKRYEDLAEMYVGDDVSPDFYGWVFPKYDHVGVGTGTVVNRPGIKQYQKAIRDRAGDKIAGGKIMKVEAHPIPEHYRPRRVVGRVALVGDAAGYVTKCSGEGIYFAAKSGRMAAEAIVQLMKGGSRLPTEKEIKQTYIKDYDRAYGPTYAVLDILQKVFYSNNGGREAFVELCESEYVQKVTFDSYLYKKVQGNNPIKDFELLLQTIGSLVRGNAMAKPDAEFSNPVESLKRLGK